ncbi:amino acid racemase [uncultured Sphaerochaeta sp.]|uniref:amino acid racemase n=1 Tax=uncultured Sphaerochaeta sp. TaxID=886478 RepID=UPI002A0A9C1C|nr:amino acid racemase [uncultured Sphaerochaeta sp.]
MKKLGLVGGMGPESTILYYQGILNGVQKAVGKDYFPPLTIESVNVFEVLQLCKSEDYDALTSYLMEAITNLASGGADFAALSANTPHIVFDRLQAASPIPLVSIIETTCAEAQRQKFTKIGLLGTIFTMTGAFFQKPFQEASIEIVTPKPTEMVWINEKISQELEFGIVKESTLEGFQAIIERMRQEDGIQALVLGCTELPLLLHEEESSLPYLDTLQLHVQALVAKILDRPNRF